MGNDSTKPVQPSTKQVDSKTEQSSKQITSSEDEKKNRVDGASGPSTCQGDSAGAGSDTGTTQSTDTTKENPTIMSSLESQLRQMLECKICFENKERQKLLPCQHTICLDCLNKLPIQGSKYKCPICNQEMLVPNGGFEALQESLITKQLASLIQMKESALPAARPSEPASVTSKSPEKVERSQSTLEDDRLKTQLEEVKLKAQNTLQQAKTKTKVYTEMVTDVEKTATMMKDSINRLVEETIHKLMLNATMKVSAIDALTENMRKELDAKAKKLTDVTEKAEQGMESLKQQTMHTNEALDQTRQAITYLEDLMGSLETSKKKLKAGDSVRLKLDTETLNTDFLLGELNHNSVGYILEVDGDGDCAVLFPENSRWTGNVRTLEFSPTKHSLPEVGDLVRIKSTVKEPHFKWGMVKPGSIGILTELKNRGPTKGRQVEVDFNEDHDWSGIFDELEKVEPEPLKVGEEVWIAKDISEPARGWANVTPTSVGKLISVNGDEVEVDFPECSGWKGLLNELERKRRITVGDQVRVKRSVTEPKFAWGGVDYNDVGKVAKIMNSSEHGQVVKVDFPNRVVHWQCLMEEVEIVRRHTMSDQATERRRRGSRPDIGCPTQ